MSFSLTFKWFKENTNNNNEKKRIPFFYPIREKIDTRETKTRKINTTRESNWIAAVGETDHDASKWWNVADNRGRWTYNNNNNNKNYKNDARLTTATAKKTATMTTTTTTTTTTDQDHHDDCDNNLLVLCWFIGIEICIAFSSRLSCMCSRKKNMKWTRRDFFQSIFNFAQMYQWTNLCLTEGVSSGSILNKNNQICLSMLSLGCYMASISFYLCRMVHMNWSITENLSTLCISIFHEEKGKSADT